MESYIIHELSFTYPERARPALCNVSLKIRQGQFMTLFGPTGGGKTTLLRQLKPILAPHGEISGEILFYGKPIKNLDQRVQSEKIGFVLQNVDNQLVTDKVWHELAFGLESLGYRTPEIRVRVAEMAAFFGIEEWFYKNVSELSGGQKQLLNLASVMAMQPSVLILDEPTSHLDPIAAVDFISTVGKINRELGITVIITEHRLEEVFPFSDRAVCLDEGRVVCDDEPRRVGDELRKLGHGMFSAMPAPMRIWEGVLNSEFGIRNSESEIRDREYGIGNTESGIRNSESGNANYSGEAISEECPITVREGRLWFDSLADSSTEVNLRLENSEFGIRNSELGDKNREPGIRNAELSNNSSGVPVYSSRHSGEQNAAATRIAAIEMNDVWFRYEKESQDVIRRLSLTVKKGEFLSVVGGNGAGKTTALMLIAGIYKPQRGRIKLFGEDVSDIPPARRFSDEIDGGVIGILPQNPQAIFVKNTVRDDLLEIFSGRRVSKEDKEKRLLQISRLCRVDTVLSSHPYDLSGGEQQRVALAKILLLRPQILLLDEPTKGLDAAYKQELAAILKNLAASGVAIVLVSHDIEFCAEYGGDRCAMFFDGSVVTEATPRDFFSGNSFYTTAANRMVRHSLPRAITANDVIGALSGENSEFGIRNSELPGDSDSTAGSDSTVSEPGRESTPGRPVRFSGQINEDKRQPINIKQDESNEPKINDSVLKFKYKIQNSELDNSELDNSEFRIPNSEFPQALPLWRKLTAAVTALLFLGTIALIIANFSGFLSFMSGGSEAQRVMQSPDVWRYAAMLITLCITGQGTVLCLTRQRTVPCPAATASRVAKRTLVAAAMIFIAVPLTIFVGVRFLEDRRYYFISMLVILETMIPFVLVFEGRKPQAREIVVIAVMCALGVAGRTAFFMLPHVKPIAALAIITGVAFGGEAGFLFGAVTGFLSNMFFGQGAWTPWQMFAYGIIGFLAGVMFRKGLLARSRTALCVYGGFAVFVIYGVIMNSSAVLMYQANPTFGMFLVYMVQGIPLDLIHAASTVMFLGILAHPMLEKLDRIKTKYGMLR